MGKFLCLVTGARWTEYLQWMLHDENRFLEVQQLECEV